MLTHHPAWNGADFWRAFYLGQQLARKGHSIRLVSSSAFGGNAPPQQIDGFSIHPISGGLNSKMDRTGYSPIAVCRRLIGLRREHFDVIQTFGHRPVVSLVARWLRQRKQSLHVADWSDLWGRGGIADERGFFGQPTIGIVDHWLERQNIQSADGVVVVSRLLEHRAQALRKSPQQIHRLGVGAADNVIEPIPKDQARAELGIAVDQHVLVHSGRSTFDQDHAMAVCQHILELDQLSSVLLLGGDSASGRETVSKNLQDRVHDLGYLSQDQMRIALGACDAVLLPMRNRGFNQARLPNRVGDAAAAGRPIATNSTGDIGRLVIDEGLGIVTDEEPSIMAAAVLDLTKDQEKLKQLGRRARKVAETKLSWSLLADRLGSFYEQLLSSA
jgi:glycosyltransferase involved in cell wall biosynthesis